MVYRRPAHREVKREASLGKGRPGTLTPEIIEQAYKLALLGCTDKQIADFFKIKIDKLNYWKVNKDEFRDALRRGKIEADMKVAESLYKRACGYRYVEKKTFKNKEGVIIRQVIDEKEMPGDVHAALRWLNARQRELGWLEKSDINIHYNNGIDVKYLTEQLKDRSKFTDDELEMALKLGLLDASTKN